MMRITVFGAGGKVGSLVVAQALAKGLYVTASIHGEDELPDHPNLKVIKGDIYKTSDVENAIRGSGAVISALSSWGTPKKNVLSASMTNIIPVMHSIGIEKIVSLTGAGANHSADHSGPLRKLSHKLMGLVAPKILEDGEAHIMLLSKSSLNWVVIRSPIMNELGTMEYKLNPKPPTSIATVNRRSVAKAMLDCLDTEDYDGQSPFIHKH